MILQSCDVTFGMTRATVEPVCTIFRSLSNMIWNGKTLQKVAGLTFGSERAGAISATFLTNDVFD